MKIFTSAQVVLTAVAFTGIGVSGSPTSQTDTDLRFVRRLQSNVGFLVVNDSGFCLTASNGVGVFVPLGLQLCDFEVAPADQLWSVDGEGKFASRLDTDFCMIVNDGETISDNDIVYIAPCNIDSTLNKFVWDAGNTDQLRPVADESFCVTHLGPLPQDMDDIRVKLCNDDGRFKWNFMTSNPYFMLESFNYEGCIELKDGKTSNGSKLVLGPCNSDQGWRYDKDGLFHSSVDDSKCMQAAQGGTIRDGSKLRVNSCDKNEKGQVFDFGVGGGAIVLKDRDLCVVFRGTTANVGVDPIILKECDVVNENRLEWDRIFI